MSDDELEQLQAEYGELFDVAERFRDELAKQLHHLITDAQISLAVPIESRTKSWGSLREKLTQRALSLKKITDLHDLIGIRLVLLFRRDIQRVFDLVEKTFTVTSKEDTASRLTENQFGYMSLHYIIALREGWLSVPSFRGSSGFVAEIQVRTAAQHIWAASSHVLQYKQEASVPLPLRRSIYRISALLETVDLEFERVLNEKDAYSGALDPHAVEPLNVDSLERVLYESWPKRNKDVHEPEYYSDLLEDLLQVNIKDTKSLQNLIEKHKEEALAYDADVAAKEVARGFELSEELERGLAGYWFTHVGLTRQALPPRIWGPLEEVS